MRVRWSAPVLAALLAALCPQATAAPLRLPPGMPRADALWSDGQDRLFVLKGDAVFECRRGAEPLEHVLPGHVPGAALAMTGSGQGRGAVVVVWDSAGHAHRYSQGAWTSAQLPADPEGALCLGAVDSAGTFACADRHGGLVLWQGGPAPAVRAYDRPQPDLTITAVTAGRPGTFYLVDKRLRILEFTSGRYRSHQFTGLISRLSTGDIGAWYSAALDRLWIAGPYRLVALDLARGAVRAVRIPFAEQEKKDPLDFRTLRGVHARGADLLWIQAQKEAYVFDGRRFYLFHPDQPEIGYRDHGDDLLYSSALSPADATFYLGGNREIQAQQLATPVLGTGPGSPLVESLDLIGLPLINLGLGPRWPLQGGDRGAAFALDLSFGVNFLWRKQDNLTSAGLWLSPQLGYSYEQGANLFVLGLGAGYGSMVAAILYTPRLVHGTIGGESMTGFRHGLSGHFLFDLIGLELVHQVTPLSGQVNQDVRLIFYVNPGVALVGAIGAMLFSPWFLRSLGSAVLGIR